MFSFLKRRSETADGLETYEEVTEKSTTRAGSLLLIIMAIFIVTIGQTIFSDLRKIPTIPMPPAYCTNDFINDYQNRQYASTCTFTDIDREFGIEEQVKRIFPALQQIVKLNSQINALNYQNSNLQRQIEQTQNQYDVSLQEKMAKEEVLYNRTDIQQTITGLRNSVDTNNAAIAILQMERRGEVATVEPYIATLKAAYEQAQNSYSSKNAWYRFKVFGLMLLFVLPIFAFTTRWYLSQKKKNSPYSIISMAVMGSFAILFLQVVLVFLYDIIPHTLIERILKMFLSVPILRYILYYGTVFIVVAVFGSIVYLIQKRIFDPRKVAVRRLKDNKCPGCAFTINPFEDYCPKCGIMLKETCALCNNKRIAQLPFCPVCGKRKPQQNASTPLAQR